MQTSRMHLKGPERNFFVQKTLPYRIVVVQLLGHVRLFVTPWTAAFQASLCFTVSWSLPKLISIDSSRHLPWPPGGTLTDTWQQVNVHMLNGDQQWDSQGARHVIQLHGAAEGHVPANQAWQNTVSWRREWQTASVFLPGEPHVGCLSSNHKWIPVYYKKWKHILKFE